MEEMRTARKPDRYERSEGGRKRKGEREREREEGRGRENGTQGEIICLQ